MYQCKIAHAPDELHRANIGFRGESGHLSFYVLSFLEGESCCVLEKDKSESEGEDKRKEWDKWLEQSF